MSWRVSPRAKNDTRHMLVCGKQRMLRLDSGAGGRADRSLRFATARSALLVLAARARRASERNDWAVAPAEPRDEHDAAQRVRHNRWRRHSHSIGALRRGAGRQYAMRKTTTRRGRRKAGARRGRRRGSVQEGTNAAALRAVFPAVQRSTKYDG